jgi:hypothetical protein
MLSEALVAPARTEDASVTVLVGAVLVAFSTVGPAAWLLAVVQSPLPLLLAPVVVLPALLLLGYEVRVVAAGIDGEPATPSFVDWTGLVRGGVGSVGIALGYLLPGAAVGGASAAVAVGAPRGLVAAPPWAVPVATVVAAAAAALNVLAFAYARPAGLVVYAATGSVGAAFSPGHVVPVLGSGRFALGWALATAGLAAGTLAAAPLAVLLVGFPLAFYARVVAHWLYGRGGAAAVVGADATADSTAAPPVEHAGAPPAVQTGRGMTVEDDRRGPAEPVRADPDTESDVEEWGWGRAE